jgi:solute carrier family 25 protein 16
MLMQMDTSKSAVTVSLTVLVMFLPNVCNSISEQLPHLFFILYRMLCWSRPPKIPTDDGGVFEDATWPLGERREKWEMAGMSHLRIRSYADSSHDLASGIGGPKADQLFTFLYGL